MSTYWFRQKQYGYGAVPITWQGWALTIASVIAIIGCTLIIMRHTALDAWFWFAVVAEFAVVAVLVQIGRRKTQGGWRWRWGDR
jgi:O-antigen/teichoic acid export membrane protein